MIPARFGPVELRNVTRSPMAEIYHAPEGVRKVRQAATRARHDEGPTDEQP
jgi:hypothetical protein